MNAQPQEMELAPRIVPNTVFSYAERRCPHDEDDGTRCITKLSRYNPGPNCFRHTYITAQRRVHLADPTE